MIFYKIGCYVLILTCLLKVVGGALNEHVPANDTEKQIEELMTNYHFDVGNGSTITMMNIQTGFAFWFAMSFLWGGIMGLFMAKQLKDNTAALRKAALINTAILSVGLVISVTYFFFIPTTCITLALISFAIAAVRIK